MLAGFQLHATYSVDWNKPGNSYLKMGSMIARDKADNVILTGYVQGASAYTRKYDKFGNLKWERIDTSGIHSNYEKLKWVNADNSKNIYVVGYRYTFSSGSDYPNAIVVLKYNPNGLLLWKQIIPGVFSREVRSDLDSKGNLYVGAAGIYSGAANAGFLLMKISPTGTLLFSNTKNFGSYHLFNSMRLKGSRIILTGSSAINGFNQSNVMWDTTGTLLWSNTLSGYSGKDVELDNNGNSYILTSYPNMVSATSGNDFVLYKFNATGNQLWQHSYDFGGEEIPVRMTLVSNKISLIGYGSLSGSYFDWIIYQVNTNGLKLWDARYNLTASNDEKPYWIVAKTNGDVFVCGQGGPMTTQPNGSQYLCYVTAKFRNGIMQWSDTSTYNGYIGYAAVLASDSSLFVLGQTYITAIHYLDYNATGSCGMPTSVTATNVASTTATISWPAVSGAYLYHLRYKTTSATTWTVISTNSLTKNITGLTAGTVYNYSVEAICNSGPSGYIATQTFTTTGVGYCTAGGVSSTQDNLSLVWIGSIQIGYSGTNGYYDFTNLSTNLTQGATINGYVSGTGVNNEFYRIWIDYNHNNSFYDAGELVWELNTTASGWLTLSFVVPANALTGSTRMRVTMKRDSAPASCGTFALGQTQDFMVNIVPLKISSEQSSSLQENFDAKIYPNPASTIATIEFILTESQDLSLSIIDVTSRLIKTISTKDISSGKNKIAIDLSELNNGIYFCKINSKENIQIIKLIKN